MAEYIEREVAIARLTALEVTRPLASMMNAKRVLADMPAADVVEVVHGKWFWADDGYCRCSECTQKAPLVQPLDDEPETAMTKYCPNCGAKMDGGAR